LSDVDVLVPFDGNGVGGLLAAPVSINRHRDPGYVGQDVAVSTLVMKNRRLTLGALLAAATVTLAVTGCGSPATPASQPTTTTPAVVASTTTAASGGCPVDAATLEKAFKANADLANAIILGGGFVNITCYQDFAVARATPTDVDAALVLFAYNKATGTWAAVTGGTAVPCGEHGVPAAVVPHLPGCAGQ
jgi:hypothetical protein